MERFSATRRGRTTRVQPHPISIDPDAVSASLPLDLGREERRLRNRLHLGQGKLLVGVDRVDYTKAFRNDSVPSIA